MVSGLDEARLAHGKEGHLDPEQTVRGVRSWAATICELTATEGLE